MTSNLSNWKLIDEDTPKDRLIIVWADGSYYNLNDLVCLCQWNEYAGYEVCELRHPTYWMEYVKPI